MIFDALTISGVAAALLAGAFLVGVVSQNDRRPSSAGGSQRAPKAEHSNGG
jgi:hypothetical protein